MADTAIDIIINGLKFYGLTDAGFLKQVEDSFRDQTISEEDDINDIGKKLSETDAFKKRFPANELLKQRGQQQFTVLQYLQLEGDFKRTLQSRGMPTGFYDDPTDFENWIATDTSPDEVAARIDQGYQAVRNAPKNVVAEFQRLYGATEGDLAAYFIDPQRARPLFDRYEAERQARAAQISAQAQQQAQMQLDVQQSEALARAGITAEQAQAGFSQISQQEQLFQAQMVGEQAVSQEQQIAGTFGTNAEARKAIEARRRRRQAAFETGGGFAGQGQASATGLTTVGQ